MAGGASTRRANRHRKRAACSTDRGGDPRFIYGSTANEGRRLSRAIHMRVRADVRCARTGGRPVRIRVGRGAEARRSRGQWRGRRGVRLHAPGEGVDVPGRQARTPPMQATRAG